MKIPTIKQFVQNTGNLAALATITTWLGHSITRVGLLHGLGFGAFAGVVASLAYPLINYYLTDDKVLASALATGVGFTASFGMSLGAASLGFVATPITLAGAALITVISVVFSVVGNLSLAYVSQKKVEQFWSPSS